MANLISSLFVKLTADTTKFQSGMHKAERRVQSTAKQFQKATLSARNLAGALGLGFGVGALFRLGNHAIQTGSAITDMAKATQTGVEEIQALTYAGREAGADQEKLANLLVRVQKSAADAARGLSTAKGAFSLLNIDAKEFLKLSPERMLETVGRKLVQSEGDVRAYGAALDLLGMRNAPKLLEVMQRLGTEGFDKIKRDAQEAGAIIDKDMAQRLDASADSLENFKMATTVAVGEAIGYWLELGAQIKETNQELHNIPNLDVDLKGVYARYLPQISDIRDEQQRVALMVDLQEQLKEASRALLEGERKARTGSGYFDQEMRSQLTAAITSYQALINKLKASNFDFSVEYPKPPGPETQTLDFAQLAEDASAFADALDLAALRDYRSFMEDLASTRFDFSTTFQKPPEIPELPEAATYDFKSRGEDVLAFADSLDISAGSLGFTAGMIKMKESSEQFYAELKKVPEGFENVHYGIIDFKKDADDVQVPGWIQDTANGVDALSFAIEDGLVNAAREGKLAFAEMGQYILAEIDRILLRSLFLRPLFSGIGSFFPEGNVVGEAFTSAFRGTKDIGGPVSAGASYIVGGKGPEVLTMGAPGMITPSSTFTGSGSTFYVDARGASAEAVHRLEALVIRLNGTIEHRAVAAVGERFRRRADYLRS